MCREGISRIRDGSYEGLKFDCWNEHESDVVKAYMAVAAPDIQFYTTWLNFKAAWS